MSQPSLVQIVNDYYTFRGLTQPDAGQAFLFLTSEVGELADAFVHDQAAWVRNNPDRERDVESEIGDILMMLTVFAATQSVDPRDAMLKKMRRKGFNFSESVEEL